MNLGGNYTRYEEIPKRVRNAIQKRIESTVSKYGYVEFRMCGNKYIQGINEELKLQKEIIEKTKELEELKKK